ncbi:MAG TPA: hypothetical protein VG122_00745 [Gemmata sp.]|nr:hypothetical protein [Gemmata sp.]
MHALSAFSRNGLPLLLLWVLASPADAQDAVKMSEEFKSGHSSKVDVVVRLDGKLTLPIEKGKAPQLVSVSGKSHIMYEERVLPSDDGATLKTVRGYREVEFLRTLGNSQQDAGIRPSVRRMVVMKSENRRAPFSPDGPLTWGEIDVVRTDVFNPVAIPGLLPTGSVRKGQTWKASAASVAELTDMEKIDSGEIVVEFTGVTEIDKSHVARLTISGTIRGVNEDGPNQQKLEGHAFFDLDAGLLTYLSLRGTHELLDGKGQTVGRIEGQFTMSRSLLTKLPPDLSDASLKGLDLKPTIENCLLLYDNSQLGIRFLYPRGWRIGVVQGRQVTLDHARGAGVFITVEPPARTPTADDYLKEVSEFLQKQKKAQISSIDKPIRVRSEPSLDRFGFDAAFGADKVHMECAVLKQTDGGVTLAATIPAADTRTLKPEVERVIRSLSITKKIEEK